MRVCLDCFTRSRSPKWSVHWHSFDYNLNLEYCKGNYDTYLKTSAELIKIRVKGFEAYLEKRAHKMEFIDKFRFNARRATLVQSCVKMIEIWTRKYLQKLKLKLNGLTTSVQRTYQSAKHCDQRCLGDIFCQDTALVRWSQSDYWITSTSNLRFWASEWILCFSFYVLANNNYSFLTLRIHFLSASILFFQWLEKSSKTIHD